MANKNISFFLQLTFSGGDDVWSVGSYIVFQVRVVVFLKLLRTGDDLKNEEITSEKLLSNCKTRVIVIYSLCKD